MIKELIEEFGELYSSKLRIDLKKEVFKWWMASILFGAKISERIAVKTYKEFEKNDLLNQENLLKASWEKLVDTLDSGGYTRYDYKTADKIMEMVRNLKEKYGKIENLRREKDIEEKLRSLAKGIGPITVNIFLRELRDIWEVDPYPQSYVILSGTNLGLISEKEKALKNLKEYWDKNKVKKKSFVNFETALLKLGRDYCKKDKCRECKFKKYCQNPKSLHAHAKHL